MGKWGGREISYGSDLDVMYIHDGDDATRGLELAAGVGRLLSEPTRHGEAYQVDVGLRPEGRKGPLSRSIDSFRRYYQDWVAPWELLALVKGRTAAGDADLLATYFEMVEPVIWRGQLGPDVVREIRRIKARVESERIPPDEDPDFHLKLGPGGLSDVEFAVQLLQLQHGGRLPDLRVTGTFPALDALRDAEILAPADHDALHDAYLLLTRIRLRLHLQRGRASDSLPTDPAATGRLAASLGFDRVADLREQYRAYTRRARRTFERVFYD
jgi:glutamate-ammonia-ligase adenylyltransferase